MYVFHSKDAYNLLRRDLRFAVFLRQDWPKARRVLCWTLTDCLVKLTILFDTNFTH